MQAGLKKNLLTGNRKMKMTWQLPLIDVWVWYLMPKEILPAPPGGPAQGRRSASEKPARQNRDKSAK
jgi:hypothetical protein